MKQREVYIKETDVAFFVMYAERKKYQRYAAAVFDKKVVDRKYVEDWIASRKDLKFVDK